MICELAFARPASICRAAMYSDIEALPPSENSLYVFDSNTQSLFPEPTGRAQLVLSPGEGAKTLASVERILDAAVARRLPRRGVMVGVGGGVICDMTAFAASVYMRGCRLILVPTTLLAMVDAALGGKTGVDYGGYKNLAGSFYPAEEVRIAPDVLDSLPEEEYINGLAEVIKYALLGESRIKRILEDRREDLLRRNPEVLKEIITLSVRMKADYITRDPLEQGVRAHLNLGHTFAHALESSGGLGAWSHGRAVAWGIWKALSLGVLLGITPSAYADEAKGLIEGFGFQTDIPIPPETRGLFIEAMRHDKKNTVRGITFVLQSGYGQTLVKKVDEGALRETLS